MALAQTSDGFLWLGTSTGLFRFDGTRFEQFRSPFGEQLLSAKIFSLFAPASGGLWIGYVSGGFSFLNNGRVTNYGGESALSSGTVGGFAEDRDGFVWASTSSGLWRFDHSSWQHAGPEWSAPPQGNLSDIGTDKSGIIWVLSFTPTKAVELSYLLPGSRKFRTVKINPSVRGFTWGSDREIVTSVASKRLVQRAGGDSEDGPPAFPVFGKNCYQIVDRTNSVWSVAPHSLALFRSRAAEISQEPRNSGFRKKTATYNISPYVRSKLVDHEGNIWFGDSLGLHRFFYSPFVRQELPASATAGITFSVVPAENGAVWLSVVIPSQSNKSGYSTFVYLASGNTAELRKLIPGGSWISSRAPDKTLWFDGSEVIWHLADGNLERVELPREMAGKIITWQVITQDRMGGLWVSFLGKASEAELYRLASGVWTHYGGRDDLPRGRVATEFTDSLGRVWFGYSHNILAVLDNDRIQVFRTNDGLAVGDIAAIYGRGPEIWIGGDFGLQLFAHGHFNSIKAADEEWLRGVTGIAETANGDLWINGLGGIFHIRHSEISLALKDSTYKVTGDHFNRREGVPGPLVMTSHPNAAIEGTDGRLWFFGGDGVVWLDPDWPETRIAPPPVSIQSISADDKFYTPVSTLKLPAHTSSVQINYAAVSLSEPEAVHIRYKLQEIDTDWHEVAAANPVSYRNLAPGSYHFSVAARDRSGAWAGRVATVEFTILPAFYQTRWFIVLCAAALIGLIWLVLRWRVKRVTAAIRERAEVRADERVRIARDLHDTLLQGIQGLMLHFHVAAQEFPEGSRPREAADRALATADRIVAEGRDRVNRLRSDHFTHKNLTDAFEAIAADLGYEQRVRFALKIEGRAEDVIPPVLNELHYIGREAISNAFRHSKASEITVRLICGPKSVVLSVADNGHGFDPVAQEINPHTGHWGLRGMKERAEVIDARFECNSTPKGTQVVVTVPAHRAYKKNSPGGTELESSVSQESTIV